MLSKRFPGGYHLSTGRAQPVKSTMGPLKSYCRHGRYTADEDEFGLRPTCPKCRSTDVVLAAIWNHFHQDPAPTEQPSRTPETM